MTKLSPAMKKMMERAKTGDKIVKYRGVGSFLTEYATWLGGGGVNLGTLKALNARGLLFISSTNSLSAIYAAKETDQ